MNQIVYKTPINESGTCTIVFVACAANASCQSGVPTHKLVSPAQKEQKRGPNNGTKWSITMGIVGVPTRTDKSVQIRSKVFISVLTMHTRSRLVNDISSSFTDHRVYVSRFCIFSSLINPPNKPPPGCLQQSPLKRYETRRVVKARPLLAEVLRSSLGVCGRRSRLRTWVYPFCPVPCSGRGRVGVNSTYGPQIGHWRQRHPEHWWKECDGTGWKCYEIHIKPGTIALVLSCAHTQLVS